MGYLARARKLRAILGGIRISLVAGTGLLAWALWFFHAHISRPMFGVIASVWLLIVAIIGYGLHVGFRDLPELEQLAKRADDEEGR